jgi:hypothetical protein
MAEQQVAIVVSQQAMREQTAVAIFLASLILTLSPHIQQIYCIQPVV